MEVTACKVCGNTSKNSLYTVKEMQLGFRDEFIYQLCNNCGCMQLQTIPTDLSKYYPSDYYSFNVDIVVEAATPVNKIRSSYVIHHKNALLGILNTLRFKPPEFFEWLRISNVQYNDKILDVGAGNGSLLVDFYKYGFTNLTGIDPFIAQDKSYGDITIYKKDIFELKEQFDYVMLHHSFEHMDEPLAVLKQLNTLLKRGKYLLIRTPVMGNYGWKRYGVNWVALDAPRHLIIHSKKSMQLLAKEAGFELKKIVYDDVDAFSIWASEQYEKDIPLQDLKRSYGHNPNAGIFSKEQMKAFKKQSAELKRKGDGDQAAFYLYKP